MIALLVLLAAPGCERVFGHGPALTELTNVHVRVLGWRSADIAPVASSSDVEALVERRSRDLASCIEGLLHRRREIVRAHASQSSAPRFLSRERRHPGEGAEQCGVFRGFRASSLIRRRCARSMNMTRKYDPSEIAEPRSEKRGAVKHG